MFRFLVPIAVLCFGGCIVPAPGGDAPGQQAQAAKRVALANAPALDLRSGANLGDKVEIDRVIAAPGRFAPGETVRMSVFYKVTDETPIDYMVFVHVEDAERGERVGQVDHPPPKPTSAWKKGDVVRDDFAVYVPPGVNARGLNVLLGLWDPKTDQRLPLRNGDTVRNDGNNRVLIAQLPAAQ